jgi:hypothetical protein
MLKKLTGVSSSFWRIVMCFNNKVLTHLGLYTLFLFVCLISAFYFGTQHYLFLPSEEARLAVPSFQDFLNLPASAIVKYFGFMDAASYIKAAVFFSLHGYFEAWTSNAWPPGQALFIAAIFKLSGGFNYPLKMLWIAIISWSFAFTFVYHTLDNHQNIFVKILLTFAPLYFHFFHAWIFDYGLLLSENVSLPLFVIAFCLFVQWLKNHKIAYIVSAAVILSILAYFRGYFEILGRFLVAVILIYLIVRLIKGYFVTSEKKILTPELLSILLSLLVFNLLLIPWRIYQFHHTGSFSWQGLTSSIWYDFWLPQTPYADSNIPCLIHPDWCQFLHTQDITAKTQLFSDEFYRTLTLATFMTHALSWYFIKIKFFNVFWFGDSNTPIPWTNLLHRPIMLFEGILIFFSGIVLFTLNSFLWMKKRLSLQKKYLFQLIFLFLIFNILLFTFFHYEPRYSLYLQVLLIYWPLWFFFGTTHLNKSGVIR